MDTLRALQIRAEMLFRIDKPATSDAAIGPVAVDSLTVFRAQLSIIAFLTIVSTAAGTALYFSEWPADSFEYRTVKLFWLDTERNIPTLYQCTSILIASALFGVLGARYGRAAKTLMAVSCFTLAVVFVFLAVDEGLGIHETIGRLYGTSYGASWSFYYIPFVLAFGVCLLPFLLRLPRETSKLLVLSGAIFVSGSVGMLGQAYAESNGKETPVYAGLATVEEVLEMLGVAVLIFALLQHLTKPRPAFRR